MPGFSTDCIHTDAAIARVPDAVQPIGVSTTFRYPKDLEAFQEAINNPAPGVLPLVGNPVYLRLSSPGSEAVEAVLSKILKGHAVVYNSGLLAFFAAMTRLNPKRIAKHKCYHGCHVILDIFTRLTHLEQIDLDDWEQLEAGDVLHLELPVNPEGIAYDIALWAERAHSKGALLVVDSTFAPPPLQDAFEQGADLVMHLATKYLGGHSDLLAGVLVTKDPEVKVKLLEERVYLGTNIGNLESFLLLRLLRSLKVRVLQQSASATAIAKWLDSQVGVLPALAKVYHLLLQTDAFIKTQMPGGFNPTFSIEVASEEIARALPDRLEYFYHATLLGGVESLIEWRTLLDEHAPKTLLRISVGLEDVEDLIEDLRQALALFS